jgi:hypothetical protein
MGNSHYVRDSRNNNVFSVKENFYSKYHFNIIKQTKKIGKFNYYTVSKINDIYKNSYNVVKTKCIYSDIEFNEKEIINNELIERDYIQLDDILFGVKVISKKKNDYYYCKDFNNVDDIINLITDIDNSNNIKLIFVSLSFYKLLYDDYKEYNKEKNITNNGFKKVKQEWDYENHCVYCDYTFLKSHTASFRNKCCQNGKFIKLPLPPILSNYCRVNDNKLWLNNVYIYNNLLAFGMLGLDKQYDSHYVNTQGHAIVLQGRTYLTHRRDNSTVALVFFTKGAAFILAGDHKQFLPVYEGGSKHDEISVSITSSEMWKLFKNNIYELTENMRLIQTNDMNDYDIQQQQLYRNMLHDVGNQTNEFIDRIDDESDNEDTKTLKLQFQNKFIINNNDDENNIETVLDHSLDWLYENGFNHDNIKSSAIIVGTNKKVDSWNKKIQQLNNNQEHVLLSTDYLADIDDDNGIIKKMLTTRVLNRKNHSSVPPHELHLKLDDVCILTR